MPARGEYRGQDFETVSFSSKPGAGGSRPTSARPGTGGASSAQRAQGSANSMTSGTGLSARKLEDETEELKRTPRLFIAPESSAARHVPMRRVTASMPARQTRPCRPTSSRR
mmetsp:Transcript_2810/g.6286  ORF Transcript_2810/g.6286 Transcript_2810/m.6286 type:complete len:112 (+) Transcript_2810:53-388(+)